jgi:AcrR family transcriptional regulator
MKTREKILQTSLLLFNEEGEPNVTTVDIANEMEISPGNLYYHYRGKEIIVEALYDHFDREMTDILSARFEESIKVEDSWFYLYVVLEQMYHYRFLYFNLSDIIRRYEKIQRRFKRLLRLKNNTASSLCVYLEKEGILVFSGPEERNVLVEQIVMTLLYWFSYNELMDRLRSKPEILMHDGVFQVMSLLAPYLADSRVEFFTECKDLYHQLIKRAEGHA